MPKIRVPANVVITDEEGNPVKTSDGKTVEIDFVRSFLFNTILNDQKFGRSVAHLFAAMDTRDAFKGTSPGSEVVISQDVWEKLKEVVSEPSTPYNVPVITHCKSFLTAILSPEK
jgi:hypothetical protein